MISQSLFVLACIVIYVQAQQPCLHAPQNPHSFAASPLSCAHYTICIGGNTVIGPEHICPPGMQFDPPTQTCGETSCMECSPFGVQNLPYPNDCSRFIECILGNRNIQICPSGLMFDRTVGQCNEAHLVYCPGQPTNPPTYPTITYPTTIYPPTTTAYPPYTTTAYPPFTTAPPFTTQPPGGTTSPPAGDQPVCRGQVFHAHPTDCTRFFICVDDVLWSHQCPSNLEWNQLRNVCDFPQYAGCIAGGGGGGGPTTPADPPLFPPEGPYDDDEEEPWTEPNLLPPNPNWL